MKNTLKAFAIFSLVLLSSCAPKFHHMQLSGPPTLGRQLIDLKEAKDRGAITDQEFVNIKMQELKLVEDHANLGTHPESHECPMHKHHEGDKGGKGEKHSCGCHGGHGEHHEHPAK